MLNATSHFLYYKQEFVVMERCINSILTVLLKLTKPQVTKGIAYAALVKEGTSEHVIEKGYTNTLK